MQTRGGELGKGQAILVFRAAYRTSYQPTGIFYTMFYLKANVITSVKKRKNRFMVKKIIYIFLLSGVNYWLQVSSLQFGNVRRGVGPTSLGLHYSHWAFEWSNEEIHHHHEHYWRQTL